MSEPAYFTRYENLSFERTEDGILTLRFHTNGGPITFTGRTHQDLPAALEDIALDSDNTGLILTGTGDVFMDSIDGDSLGEIFKPLVWEKIRREGLAVLQRLLSLPIPVVGVANGPATVHSEYLLLTDVHCLRSRHLRRLPASRLRDHRRRRPAGGVGGDRRHRASEVAAVDG